MATNKSKCLRLVMQGQTCNRIPFCGKNPHRNRKETAKVYDFTPWENFIFINIHIMNMWSMNIELPNHPCVRPIARLQCTLLAQATSCRPVSGITELISYDSSRILYCIQCQSVFCLVCMRYRFRYVQKNFSVSRRNEAIIIFSDFQEIDFTRA